MLTYRLGPYNLPAIPLGLVAFIVLVPAFWSLPRRYLRAGIIGTSLLFSLLTWPVSWCMTLAAGILYVYLVLFVCQRWVGGRSGAPAPRGAVVFAWAAILAGYVPALVWPTPSWLPHEPLADVLCYYWVQWFGLGCVALRALHLTLDTCHGRVGRIGPADYLAFMLFAPTLRMGPIMRYQDFHAQLDDWPARRELHELGVGLGRIALGLVRLGIMYFVVSRAMKHAFWEMPEHYSRLVVLRSAALAPIYLYLWMSGYADIAIGLGRMMGFVVPENFTRPWLSDSIRTFWRRWNITVGRWLFDYVYIPLGGSRRFVLVAYLATFLFCGLWHGLLRSYVAWGVAQGLGLYVNRRWSDYWARQRERQSNTYQKLKRWHVVGGRPARLAGGLLTVAYQILTIAVFMDERYAGTRWLPYLLGIGHG
jgi:D-alanyl-lipoteichoic acid acyltransferase DltB (MBOAT superfamily)